MSRLNDATPREDAWTSLMKTEEGRQLVWETFSKSPTEERIEESHQEQERHTDETK
tara:strand:- start:314 stop:481 length:168 start_codon:yes stop_codon:yes gene_type:complete